MLLLALIGLWLFLVFTRSDVQATFLRAQGALFQQMPDGHFSNLYTVKIMNKTSRDMPIELRLGKSGGRLAGDGPGHRRAQGKARREFRAD